VNKKTNNPTYKYSNYADYKASFDKEDAVRKEKEAVETKKVEEAKENVRQSDEIRKINAQKPPTLMSEADWTKGHKRFGPNDRNRPMYSYASYEDYKSGTAKAFEDKKTNEIRRARKQFTPEEIEAQKRWAKNEEERLARVAAEKEPTKCPDGEKFSRRRAYDLGDSVCVERPNAFGVPKATAVEYRELVGLDKKVRCNVPGHTDKYHYDTPDKCAEFSEHVIQSNIAHQEADDNSFGSTAARWGQDLAKMGVSKLASAAAAAGANALLPGSGFVASMVTDAYLPKALDSIWDTRTGVEKYLSNLGTAPEYRDPTTQELIPEEPWSVRNQRIQNMVDGVNDIPAEKLGYDPTDDDWGTHQEDYGKFEIQDRKDAAYASMHRGRGRVGRIPMETRLKLLLQHCKP
jgi:hypothetical protein